MVKIGILGCSGRMGQALIQATVASPAATLSGGTVREGSQALGRDLGQIAGLDVCQVVAHVDPKKLFKESDVVIDFTTPDVSIEAASIAAGEQKALVVGTTGLTDSQIKEIERYSQSAPILWSANMSVGVNLLAMLTEKLASLLDEDFDIEVLEMHHRHKVDAPSGTALMLGNAAAKGRKVLLDDVACKARDGIVGQRPRGEIGFATLRGGDVVGEHSVIFAGEGERIELTHKASNRSLFAKGAVRAALWLHDKPAKFYTMRDMLSV